MSAYTTNDYALMAKRRSNAFRMIADKLGEAHPISVMMGSLSYSRHRYERGPDQNGLRHTVAEYAFLEGFFDCLNLWARDNDSAAQKVMLDLWPRGMEKANP